MVSKFQPTKAFCRRSSREATFQQSVESCRWPLKRVLLKSHASGWPVDLTVLFGSSCRPVDSDAGVLFQRNSEDALEPS